MVSPTLTTPGVKRKLHNGPLECRSCEATEAIDLWIYVDPSRPWDIRGIGRLAGGSSDFGAPGDFAGRRS
jgi:hypothetical protein